MIGSRQIFLAALAAIVLEFLLLLALIVVAVPPDSADPVREKSEPPSPPRQEVLATLMPVLPIPPPPPVEEKLTFQVVDTQANAPAPDRPTPLISDQASRAATEEASRNESDNPMPTVSGVAQPGFDLVDQKFQDGESDAAATGNPATAPGPPAPDDPSPPRPPAPEMAESTPEPPAPKPPVPENPSPAARPDEVLLPMPADLPRLTVPRPEDLLRPRPDTATPTRPSDPAVTDTSAVPPRPPPGGGGGGNPGFQSEKVKRALEGTLSQRGKASLDVEDTPLGRYLKSVSRVIERDWQQACRRHRDLATPGFLRVNFTIAADGRVISVRSVDARDGGEASKWFTMNSVKQAKLPPIPPEVVEMLENGQVEINFNFLFF